MAEQLSESGSVTLDSSGNGTLALKPWGGGVTWWPTTVSVKASSATKEAAAKVYVGPAATDQYFVAATLSGSSGDSTGRVTGHQVDTHGQTLWIVWTGGDVGASATAVVRGVSTRPGEPSPFDPAAMADAGDFTDPLVGGDGTLVYPAIKSGNYAAGVSGWTIKKDGSAEFNNLTVRGSFFGAKYEITSDGAFFYSGTPANGNLVASIVPGTTDVTDNHSNTAHPGICVYGGASQPFLQAFIAGTQPTGTPRLYFKGNVTSENIAAQLASDVANKSASNESLEFNLFGPSITQQKDYVAVYIHSSLKDLSFPASGNLLYWDPTSTQHKYAFWDNTGFHVLAGSIVAVDPTTGTSVANPASGETWHTLGGQAAGGPSGWTTDHGRYQMDAFGRTEIDIMFHSTGTGNAGTIGFNNTLDADYRPSKDRIYPLGVNDTSVSAFMHVTTAGVVTLIVPAASKLGCNVHMPLD